MSGGPSPRRYVRPEAGTDPAARPEAARSHSARSRPAAGWTRTSCSPRSAPSASTARAGIEVSDWFPHLAGCVDDLCVLRGCYGDSVTHPESVYLMNTGSILMGRPSLGAWAAYGLGTENRNMPAFVVLPDPGGWPKGGAPAWGNGFLPAAYQGTLVRGGVVARSLHLQTPAGVIADQQRRHARLHRRRPTASTWPRRGGDSELAARIAAYELAFRMQAHAPEVVDAGEGDARRRSGSTAWTARRRPSSACAACWPGGWSSAACASCRSTAATPTAGTPTRDLEGNHGRLCLAERQADRRPADGPESAAACWIRRWSSGAASSAARR